MPKPKITSTKLVSIPTAHAWSQVYHAGNLVALLSLSYVSEDTHKEQEPLSAIGKELLTTLEAEYFTLEEKNLSSIKKAVQEMIDTLPAHTQATIIVATVIDTILYLFLSGKGKVMLRREGKIGVLLESQELAIESETRNLLTASGYLHHNDQILLTSNMFFEVVSRKDLFAELEKHTTQEAAENFDPILHDKREGAAACAIIDYHGDTPVVPMETVTEIKEEPAPIIEHEKPVKKTASFLSNELSLEEEIEKEKQRTEEVLHENEIKPVESLPKKSHTLPKLPSITRKQRIFLTIAVIIAIVFIGTLLFSMRKHTKTETAEFPVLYAQAETKYNEGLNLKTLNTSGAQTAFTQAKDILEKNQGNYPETTDDGKKFHELLNKVTVELSGIHVVSGVSTKEVDSKDVSYLAVEIKHPESNYFTEATDLVITANNSALTSIDETTGDKKDLVKNNSTWNDIGGLGNYLGNIYLLDKKANQIFKFAKAASEYGKSNYFSGTAPDLSKATALAIDGSIYILMNDGSIKKYTKGKEDTFNITGLQKPLTKPTRIASTVDGNILYILDQGNSRIVALQKSGSFVAEYPSEIIANAKDLTISEKDKKIFILNKDKIYQIDMK